MSTGTEHEVRLKSGTTLSVEPGGKEADFLLWAQRASDGMGVVIAYIDQEDYDAFLEPVPGNAPPVKEPA